MRWSPVYMHVMMLTLYQLLLLGWVCSQSSIQPFVYLWVKIWLKIKKASIIFLKLSFIKIFSDKLLQVCQGSHLRFWGEDAAHFGTDWAVSLEKGLEDCSARRKAVSISEDSTNNFFKGCLGGVTRWCQSIHQSYLSFIFIDTDVVLSRMYQEL